MNKGLSLSAPDDRWRSGHLGRLMGLALRRFDERVLDLMARDAAVPLALSNLAARAQVNVDANAAGPGACDRMQIATAAQRTRIGGYKFSYRCPSHHPYMAEQG